MSVATKTRASDYVTFRGHPNVLSLHPTTIEVTTEENLTRSGDCIIGVGASKGCLGLAEAVKAGLRTEGSEVTFKIVVGLHSFSLKARGDPRLTLTDPHDIVIRRSDFVSDRTVALGAEAAAGDLPRTIVRELQNPAARGSLEIQVS